MITKENIIPNMIQALPGFQSNVDAFLAEWQVSEDEPPLYVLLSEFARYLIGMLEVGNSTALSSAFMLIEEWQKQGNSYVVEAVIIGVLECLQNPSLHQCTSPKQFEKFLGEKSRLAWEKLNSFWNKKE